MMNTANLHSTPATSGSTARLPWSGLTCAAFICLAGPVPGSAQDRNDEMRGIEEVIVTARRREESVRDLPSSVTVFNGEALIANNITDMQGYFLRTPNVAIIETPARNENFIGMRGISNTGDSQPATSFAYYLDEFNVQPITNNIHLNDIGNVEVLRGPQGTYFGANAAGGAINLVSRKPGPEFDANAMIGFGRFNTWNVEGMVNAPVSETFFIRASASYLSSDGIAKNAGPAGGSASQDFFNGRLQARWAPTEEVTLDLTFMHANDKQDEWEAVHTHMIPPNELFIAAPPGNAITEGLAAYPENKRLYTSNEPKGQDYKYSILFGRFQYEADQFIVTALAGWGESDHFSDFGSGERTGFDIIRTYNDDHFSMKSGEIRIASNGDNVIDWTIGAHHTKVKREFNITVETGDDIGVINLGAGGLPPGFRLVNDRSIFSSPRNQAVFGEINWHVNDRVTLTYGGRYNSDKDTRSQTDLGGAVQSFAEQSETFKKYISKFAATFEVNDNHSLYAVASQGYKQGGTTLGAPAGLDSVDPETLWNFELGIKGSLMDGRARYSLSGFYIDWKDLQVSTRVNILDPEGGSQVVVAFQNAAEASSQGIEFDFQAAATDQLTLGFALGWLDGEYDSFPDAVIPGLGSSVDLSGEQLLHAPQWTISADAQFDFAIGDSDAYVRAEWAYVDDKLEDLMVYFPRAAIPPLPDVGIDYYFVPSYNVVNLRAGMSWGNYRVTAFVENLFDENYYNGTYTNFYASGIAVRPHVRTWGVQLRWNY